MSNVNQQEITFSKNDVEIIARETLYRGFFSLDLYRFRHRLFNGEMSGEVTREIFERGHAAVLLPFDPCVMKWCSSSRSVLRRMIPVRARGCSKWSPA